VEKINHYLEHTLVHPETTLNDVKRICEEAIQYDLAAVCIPPLFVRDAKRWLGGEEAKTKVVTVIGFPMGYSALAAKTEEIKRAVDEGADEIDGMINLAALKSGNWNHVENDIEGMALATNMKGKTLKLIVEVASLTEEELKRVTERALSSRVKYVTTGAGIFGKTVTPDMVTLLRKIADPALKIKATGELRDKAAIQRLIDAGADRIGTTAALSLV
jgi:deoxyribose-phosphate aldolase